MFITSGVVKGLCWWESFVEMAGGSGRVLEQDCITARVLSRYCHAYHDNIPDPHSCTSLSVLSPLGCATQTPFVTFRDVRFLHKVGQINPKRYNFLIWDFSKYFRFSCWSLNVLKFNLIWKNPGLKFIQFRANLTHFAAKSDSLGHIYTHRHATLDPY